MSRETTSGRIDQRKKEAMTDITNPTPDPVQMSTDARELYEAILVQHSKQIAEHVAFSANEDCGESKAMQEIEANFAKEVSVTQESDEIFKWEYANVIDWFAQWAGVKQTFRAKSYVEAVRNVLDDAGEGDAFQLDDNTIWIHGYMLEFTCPRDHWHGIDWPQPSHGDDSYEIQGDNCGWIEELKERFKDWLKEWREDNPWHEIKWQRLQNAGQVRWLIPGVLERGKLMGLFGAPKEGKSLWALEEALKLASKNVRVLYLDEENDKNECFERAMDMGYDLSASKLSRLKYKTFMGLNVDDEEDAAKILEMADGFDLVVFDSYAKFFKHGSQNDDAAINRAYRLVLKPLREKGVSVIRLDHTGHGEAKRPAGSVQKLADVDHNWLIRAEDGKGRAARRVTLTHCENRTGRGEDLIVMDRLLDPLRHVVRGAPEAVEDIGQGEEQDGKVQAVVEALDALGAPIDFSVRRCLDLLKQDGKKVDRNVLADAVRRRKVTVS
jgi:hypothetical protein